MLDELTPHAVATWMMETWMKRMGGFSLALVAVSMTGVKAASQDGVIALQLHRGPTMTVRFKNIKLRKLN